MDRKPYYGTEARGTRAPSGRSGSVGRSSPHTSDRSASPRASGSAHGAPRRPMEPGRAGAAAPSGRSAAPRRPEADRNAGRMPGRPLPAQDGRPPARPPQRRRKKKAPLARLIPLAILALILAGAIHVGSAWLTATVNRSTYLSNVYVNGIDVSDYTREAGRQYVREQMDARLSAVYTLSGGGSSWSFTAADFGGEIEIDSLMERAWNFGHVGSIFDRKKAVQSLKENPIYLNAPLEYDQAQIDAFVDEIYDAVYVAPSNAMVAMDVNKPYLVAESSRGQELDKETARAQIVDLLEHGEGALELPLLLLEPELSTETALSTMNLIVEYKTDVSFRDYNSRYNVRKALNKFIGMTVNPGETIDFNAVVGPRTQAAGWMSATEFVNNTSQKGYGGGVCQASSTLYGAMLISGMSIIERWPHSMTVSYVDPSLDAAVTETSKNLIFRNDTETSIYILTEVTNEYAIVRVYGQRPKYRYELQSNILSKDTAAVRVSYIPDNTGKYCYYENETKLHKEGIPACSSEGWRIAYDWDTGEEVNRRQLSFDQYESGTDIYWRGVHPLNEVGAAASDSNNQLSDLE